MLYVSQVFQCVQLLIIKPSQWLYHHQMRFLPPLDYTDKEY